MSDDTINHAAPVTDEQCADHLDRLAALRLDSIGADAWQEAFARGASALRAAPAPVRVSQQMVETGLAQWEKISPALTRDDSEMARLLRRHIVENILTAALAAQEGSRGCKCGHPNAEHVAVYSGGVNTLDCTKCDCTVYPRNFPTEDSE